MHLSFTPFASSQINNHKQFTLRVLESDGQVKATGTHFSFEGKVFCLTHLLRKGDEITLAPRPSVFSYFGQEKAHDEDVLLAQVNFIDGTQSSVVKKFSLVDVTILGLAKRAIHTDHDLSPYEEGMRGSLRDLSLKDVLFLMQSKKKSARIDLLTKSKRGSIRLRSGAIFEARFGDTSGAQALKILDGVREGSFRVYF